VNFSYMFCSSPNFNTGKTAGFRLTKLRYYDLVTTTAARSLGNFPSQADIIVPVLLKDLHDTNGIISRWGPADALKAIDPAAAAKAGIK
jgi:hypothetical protein